MFRQFLKLDDNFVEPLSRDQNNYISGGFIENISQPKHNSKYNFSAIKMREYQKKEFEEILLILNSKKIPIILVRAPITQYRYEKITNNFEINNFFKSKGIYFDFNEILDLSDSDDFIDSHHLNQNGVDIFNYEMIKLFETRSYLKKSSSNQMRL